MPKSRDSKERHAFIFSVYLRAWTWSDKLVDKEVQHLTNLGLPLPVVRNSWRTFFQHVPPHSHTMIRNFLGCCMAEGPNDNADNDEDDADGSCIDFQWSMENVTSALQHVRKSRDDDTAITKSVERSTTRARNLTSIIVHNDLPQQREQAKHCIKKLEKYTPTHDDPSPFLPTYTSAVTFQQDKWAQINHTWGPWHAALLSNTQCTPTQQQRDVIECVHLRTKYEHFLENNLPMQDDIKHLTPKPMFHLLHGIPGAGKSKVLQWLQSYWETVWKYERGVHFAFVA